MARKPTQVKVDVDGRTAQMPIEALDCRGWNHPWVRVPTTAARRAELLTVGRYERVRTCHNNCGCTWTQEYSIVSGDVEYDDREYPDNYKAPKGQGRIPKRESRKAFIAREMNL